MTGRIRPAEPADPGLGDPGMGLGHPLLDSVVARDLLAATLPGRVVDPPRPKSLWYKPGRRLIVRYDVVVDGRARTAALWIERSREPRAIWFPDDPFLLGLSGPGGLSATLRAGGLDPAGRGHPTAIAWKPRARAVVRSSDDIIKAYGDDDHYAAAAAALRLVGGGAPFSTARCRALIPERRTTVQEFVPGEPARVARDARLAGELLRRLHGWSPSGSKANGAAVGYLHAVPPPLLLQRASESAAVVVAVHPDLANDVAALLDRLEASAPRGIDLTLSHGDFEAGQVIVGPGVRDGGAIVDVDDLCLSAPAFDIANYVVHALRGPDGLVVAEGVLDDFLAGYGPRPPALQWHLAVCALIRAPAPFRKLHERWRDSMATTVRAGQPLLAGRAA